MTEPTRVASQARAKLMALTGNIRENLLQQFLSITTVIFTNTLLHSEDVAPAWAALQQCLHSFNTKENASTFARGSQKSQKHGILSYINKTQGEIKSPTGERIRAGLSDAVRSFLWTVTGPCSEDSPDYQGLQRGLLSFGDTCFRAPVFPGEKETSGAADWLFWKWLKSLVCVSVRTLWRERKWKASCRHLE